jgi:hypothetical protein
MIVHKTCHWQTYLKTYIKNEFDFDIFWWCHLKHQEATLSKTADTMGQIQMMQNNI